MQSAFVFAAQPERWSWFTSWLTWSRRIPTWSRSWSRRRSRPTRCLIPVSWDLFGIIADKYLYLHHSKKIVFGFYPSVC